MPRHRTLTSELIVLVLVSLSVPAAFSQKTADSRPLGLLDTLPSAAAPHAQALGDRVLRAGKERTILAGQLVNERGEQTPMRVALQLPRMVGLEGLRPNALVFDGRTPVYSVSKTEEELLEIFSSDTAEAMLSFVREEAAVQLLGRWVREDSDLQNAVSQSYDIFEVAVSVPSSAARMERLKRYAFDSATGLLANTQYLDETFSPPVRVEIRFSDWRGIEGSAYPGRIDRLENGRLSFSWIVTRIQALPRQDPSNFAIPREAGQQEEQ